MVKGWLCVPNVMECKKDLMKEAHNSTFTTHIGSTKMYHDLKTLFWWTGMKRDMADFVAGCLTCKRKKT